MEGSQNYENVDDLNGIGGPCSGEENMVVGPPDYLVKEFLSSPKGAADFLSHTDKVQSMLPPIS